MSFGAIEQISDFATFGEVRELTALVNAADDDIRRAFLNAIGRTRGLIQLEELAALAEAGRLVEAAALSEQIVPDMVDAITLAYTAAGVNAANVLTRDLDRFIDFNPLSTRAISYLQATRLDLVRALSEDTRQVLQLVLTNGIERGLAPIEIAREARASLGLTPAMEQFVENYRTNLEQGSKAALGRELRDKRFDRTVERSIRTGVPLTQSQIDRMVNRYRQNWVAFRAQTIALTEAQRAVQAGDEELWLQAVDRAEISPNEAIGTWHTAGDERVRSSHAFMNGQKRPLGQPFRSGDGNNLRFPADPAAPASDVIRCRCVVSRRLSRSTLPLR